MRLARAITQMKCIALRMRARRSRARPKARLRRATSRADRLTRKSALRANACCVQLDRDRDRMLTARLGIQVFYAHRVRFTACTAALSGALREHRHPASLGLWRLRGAVLRALREAAPWIPRPAIRM
jgi:hypothetical protein